MRREMESLPVEGLSRRRLIEVGGLTIATSALLAACGGGGSTSTSGSTSTTAGIQPGDPGDILVTKTASSIEALLVAVYSKALDGKLISTPSLLDAAQLFHDQHAEHAQLFGGATEKLGSKAVTQPNTALQSRVQAQIDGLKDEAGVAQLVYLLENVAAATYQSTVGTLKDPTLNVTLMSVGGVEARHASVLSSFVKQPPVPKAFATTDGAVASGSGV